MGWEFGAAHDGPKRQIKSRKPTTTVSHEQLAGRRIKPDVVGVVAETDRARWQEIVTTEQAHRSVAGTCHRDQVRPRGIADALRFFQPVDPMDYLHGRKVDHID